MIVVDASVVVAALAFASSSGDSAREALALGDLHAPHLLDLEVLSALRDLANRLLLEPGRAMSAVSDFADLSVVRYPHTPFLGEIWKHRLNLSSYDAAYVVLAERLDAPLLTGDRHLAQAPGLACEVRLME